MNTLPSLLVDFQITREPKILSQLVNASLPVNFDRNCEISCPLGANPLPIYEVDKSHIAQILTNKNVPQSLDAEQIENMSSFDVIRYVTV